MKKMRIGWIGTGIMGSSMADNLINAGYELTVFNRRKEKAEKLLSCGAHWAGNPSDLAAKSDAVFSIVGYPSDVEEVLLGEKGVLCGLNPGGIVCDMTTSSPTLARKIAEAASEKGCFALDAPVTGGDIGAREGTLSIFVGGDKKAFERLYPCFEAMGKTIMHCGGAGSGQQAKLANQVAVAGATFGMCESLLFAQESGLDLPSWLNLVVNGAAGSTAMRTSGQRLLHGDLEPGFIIDHFVKDLGLCLEECRRMQIILPCTELAEELYRSMQAQAEGNLGTQALITSLARLSGKKWRSHA